MSSDPRSANFLSTSLEQQTSSIQPSTHHIIAKEELFADIAARGANFMKYGALIFEAFNKDLLFYLPVAKATHEE